VRRLVRKKNSNSLAENRKARHDYFIEETVETGIELVGTEVKSIRLGKCNLKECYADVYNGEVFIKNMHISPYDQGNIFNVDPLRIRKLLLHKSEIFRLQGLVQRDGYALVPLSLYLKNGRVKVALGLCRGKKDYDKRDSMLEKAHKRDMDRAIKERNR
jgi:SsrA-binding protein